MKRIENRKIYHAGNFHKRHFDFKFDRDIILLKKNASDDSVHKKIGTNTIRSCTVNNGGYEAFSSTIRT